MLTVDANKTVQYIANKIRIICEWVFYEMLLKLKIYLLKNKILIPSPTLHWLKEWESEILQQPTENQQKNDYVFAPST